MSMTKETIRGWRDRHKGELEKSLKVAMAIRDDSLAKDKDKVDAIKTIARMLGGLAPERGSKSSSVSSASDTLKTTPEEDKMLGDILGKPCS
jgi:hypothetical protein